MTTKESLKIIGEDILKQCPDTVRRITGWPGTREVYLMDPEAFSTQVLHLHRKVMRLSTDGSIIGAAVFEHNQTVTTYTVDGEMMISRPLNNTIYIDRYACMLQDLPVPDSRFRFTEMHEACHHILVRMGFMESQPVMYRKTNRAESREERMADYLAAYLLMQDSVLIAMMKSRDYRPLVSYEDVMPRADERFFTNMTRSLQVSSSALARRLRDAGFWEDRSIYEYEDPERPWGFDPIGGVMP